MRLFPVAGVMGPGQSGKSTMLRVSDKTIQPGCSFALHEELKTAGLHDIMFIIILGWQPGIASSPNFNGILALTGAMNIRCKYCVEYFCPGDDTPGLLSEGYISTDSVKTCEYCWNLIQLSEYDYSELFSDADPGL